MKHSPQALQQEVQLQTSPFSSSTSDAKTPSRLQWVWQRLRRDKVGFGALMVVIFFLCWVLLAALGLIAQNWQQELAVPNAPPAFWQNNTQAVAEVHSSVPTEADRLDLSDVDPLQPYYSKWREKTQTLEKVQPKLQQTLMFGADRLGRDIVQKAIKGAQVSIAVGLTAALLATALGTFLGALSEFWGRLVGDALEWLYNVFTAVPGILLIFAFAAVLGRGTWTVALILGLTGWTGVYRLVRGEFIKHKAREYVRAAQALGIGTQARMWGHILPNVSSVILAQLSLLIVGFIKAEVILSYLGLGVSLDEVSWGTMLAEAQSELLLGQWWQLVAATGLMAVFVTASSLFTDALRDALDPALKVSN